MPPFLVFKQSFHNDDSNDCNDDIIVCGLNLDKDDVLEIFQSVFDCDKDNDDVNNDDCDMENDEKNEQPSMTDEQWSIVVCFWWSLCCVNNWLLCYSNYSKENCNL